MPTSFGEWFQTLTGARPHPWQEELGKDPSFGGRLIRVPTGLGKTLGVMLAWAYHRIARGDEGWPRRLVWCLPMRVLVEQTVDEARRVLERMGVLWDERGDHEGKAGVHVLMGGADGGAWHLFPEAYSVLIGTQDMLLSRALNRGYGAARARWPMDFGLLNQDCLWVLDEVQLMDVGLATSSQLDAFRRATPSGRPVASWWMSATLQPSWLITRDTQHVVNALPRTTIPPPARRGALWDDVAKTCSLASDCVKPPALAKRVLEEHERAGSGRDGPTLVIVNTVERAVELAKALRALVGSKRSTDVRIVHSRFRSSERRGFRETFLHRDACGAGADRIIVATQVVEAGVDISARVLFTDIAPWPSLVQRFGRAARWGGTATVIVVDTAPKDEKAALPYTVDAIDSARDALQELWDVAPKALELFEERLSADRLAALYPYEPEVLLLRHEVDELFDTSPDLSGSDTDIGRFIRSGEERDLLFFWAEVPESGPPPRQLRPGRDALCPVPFAKARAWLCGKGRTLQKKRSAWVWSYLDGAWREAEARDLYPGQTVLVDANFGGYDWVEGTQQGYGWSPVATAPVPIVALCEPSAAQEADASEEDDSLSALPYRTIGTHGAETGDLAATLAERLVPELASLLRLAGRWHDLGKAHPAFQGSIEAPDKPRRDDLAKAPDRAWPRRALYRMPDGSRRPGFRHELASALALFAVVRRHEPMHAALLGRWAELLSALGESALGEAVAQAPPTATEREVLALSAEEFDLLAYLVASHHGKVRAALHATPKDQDATMASGQVTIRGIRTGDALPAIRLGPDEGQYLPATTLDLAPASVGLSATSGASWTERVAGLLARLGPFRLAWLEAILRAADQRASGATSPDPMLAMEES